MNYIELNFTIISSEDYIRDLIINDLSRIGFDSFEYTDLGFKAFCPSSIYSEANVKEVIEAYKSNFTLDFETNLIPAKNWNEVWESNFEPVIVNQHCVIRASFHPEFPAYKYQLLIDPKMAFGTGHHDTTRMMCEYMLECDISKKSVLDMGCGTGILAILAGMMGAEVIVAIDNDEIAVRSTIENAKLNNVENINAFTDVNPKWETGKANFIFANINRNVLIEQMKSYSTILGMGGQLFMSGFYEKDDLEMIKETALIYNLKYQDHKMENSWAAAKFCKI